MTACKDCPISLVCIAADLGISNRRHEHCRFCGKYWVSYYASNDIWRMCEAPGRLMCSKVDMITCERCIFNGTRKEHPSPDDIQFTVMKLTSQLPLDVIEEQQRILRSALAVPPDILGLHITNARVTLTLRQQLELPLMAGVHHDICKHLAIPSSFLKKKGQP